MAEPVPITDFKDIRKLRTNRPQNRDPARSELRPIHTWDTETYDGNIFLIANSERKFLDEITPESVLDLLSAKKYQSSWNFFYNLGYDAEVILKLLGKELYRYGRTGNLVFQFDKYKITYIPNKCLRIAKGHHSASYYDIAQYYHASLSDAYQTNIGKLPDSYLEIKGKRSQFSPRFYKRNKKLIRDYCIQDCIYTKQLPKTGSIYLTTHFSSIQSSGFHQDIWQKRF